MKPVVSELYSGDIKAMVVDECPLECDQMKYMLTLSSSAYPTPAYFNFLKHSSIVKQNDKNLTEITLESVKPRVLTVKPRFLVPRLS